MARCWYMKQTLCQRSNAWIITNRSSGAAEVLPNQTTTVSSPVPREKLKSNHKFAFWWPGIQIWSKHSVSAQMHELQPTAVQVQQKFCRIRQPVFLVQSHVISSNLITNLHSDGQVLRYEANTLSALKCMNYNQPQFRCSRSFSESGNQCFLSSFTWKAQIQ